MDPWISRQKKKLITITRFLVIGTLLGSPCSFPLSLTAPSSWSWICSRARKKWRSSRSRYVEIPCIRMTSATRLSRFFLINQYHVGLEHRLPSKARSTAACWSLRTAWKQRSRTWPRLWPVMLRPRRILRTWRSRHSSSRSSTFAWLMRTVPWRRSSRVVWARARRTFKRMRQGESSLFLCPC